MLIIVEGCDKAGKTTLCNKLSELLNWKYEHFGKPGNDPAKEYANFLLDLKESTICDRFYVGELIYGPLLRRKKTITPLEITVIERLCRLRGGLLVHVDPPYEVVERRYNHIGDPDITEDQNKKAHQLFRNIVPHRNIPTIHWMGGQSIASLATTIANIAYYQELAAKTALQHCTGIGTIYGSKVVLVGDTLNVEKSWLGVPFDRSMAAEYLLECMQMTDVREDKIYIVNSDTLSWSERDFLESQGAKWIALGNNAWETLGVYGIKAEKVPHPQYWRRFNHSNKKEYAELIQKAVIKAEMRKR